MIDLNLIKVFITIFETKNVSLAAEKLNLTQPSVSHHLMRLRYLFKDKLFTRTKLGMMPTIYAIKLYDELNHPLLLIENTVKKLKDFDPLKSEINFKLALSDLDGIYIVPKILSEINKIAPNISLEIVHIEINKVADGLVSGKIDAAICHKLNENKGILTFKLFREKYICLLRKNNLVKYKLSLYEFAKANHMIVSSSPINNFVETYLDSKGLRHRIKIKSSYLGLLTNCLNQNDLIFLLPLRIGMYSKLDPRTQVFDLPFDTPVFDIMLHWHKSKEDLNSQKWFIGFLKNVLADV